jgi:hypothetical protein
LKIKSQDFKKKERNMKLISGTDNSEICKSCR